MSTQAAVNTASGASYRLVKPTFRVIEGGARRHQGMRVTGTARQQNYALIMCCLIVLVLGVAGRLADLRVQHRVAQAISQAEELTVTVMPGDSLWSIAEQHPVEGCTTAQLVHHIAESNDVSSAALKAGMRLSVPCSRG